MIDIVHVLYGTCTCMCLDVSYCYVLYTRMSHLQIATLAPALYIPIKAYYVRKLEQLGVVLSRLLCNCDHGWQVDGGVGPDHMYFKLGKSQLRIYFSLPLRLCSRGQ